MMPVCLHRCWSHSQSVWLLPCQQRAKDTPCPDEAAPEQCLCSDWLPAAISTCWWSDISRYAYLANSLKENCIRFETQFSYVLIFHFMFSLHDRGCFCPGSAGLPSHPQHELSKKQTKGFGGMVSFRIKGTIETAKKFIDSLKVAMAAFVSCFSIV